MVRIMVDDIAKAEVKSLHDFDLQIIEYMTELFIQSQENHIASYPQHFCLVNDKDKISAYLRGFFKPKNPFRSRVGFVKGWYVDQKLCGYLLYYLNNSASVFYNKKRWNCFIDDIVVHEEYRSMGGASKMIEALLEDLKQYSNCKVSATVWRGNLASEALFEKYGFAAGSQNFYKVY